MFCAYESNGESLGSGKRLETLTANFLSVYADGFGVIVRPGFAPEYLTALASMLRKRMVALAQISISDAEGLLNKLLSERTAVHALLVSPSGARSRISGFLDSKTRENGLVVSTSGPPLDAERGYIVVRPFDRECSVWYGEKRELPPDLQHLSDTYGESALVFGFTDFDEWFALFFTV